MKVCLSAFFFLFFIANNSFATNRDYCVSGCTYSDPEAAYLAASSGDTILQNNSGVPS